MKADIWCKNCEQHQGNEECLIKEPTYEEDYMGGGERVKDLGVVMTCGQARDTEKCQPGLNWRGKIRILLGLQVGPCS